jgi:hypothetical protein
MIGLAALDAVGIIGFKLDMFLRILLLYSTWNKQRLTTAQDSDVSRRSVPSAKSKS